MKLSRTVALGVAAAALALPAVASAHPAVYTTQQLVFETGDPCRITDAVDNDVCIQNNQRTTYAVGNDGWASAFTETAGSGPAGRGMVNYRFLPGTWRGTATPENRALWLSYAPAKTNLQPHASCTGAAWDTTANILAWQNDPFYNYIPWQKTSANLGDDPAKWIAVVKTATGVDLSTLNSEAEFTAACTTAGGTYHKADTASSITTALVGAAVTAATTPLNAQITDLKGQVSTLQSQVDQLKNDIGVLEAAKLAAESAQTQANVLANTRGTDVSAAQAALAASEAARQALINRPLATSLLAKRFEEGVALVTGKAGTPVTVTLTLGAADAKKLKIGETLSTKTATIGEQGAAQLALGLTSKAAKAVDKHKRALKVTLTATGGGATSTATGTLTR